MGDLRAGNPCPATPRGRCAERGGVMPVPAEAIEADQIGLKPSDSPVVWL